MYILKLGKMYLQAIYVDSLYPETNYIHSLEFTNEIDNIYNTCKFKTYEEASYTRDILRDILYEINLIDIVEIDTIKEGE